jgi:hypothetical protein
MRAIFGMRFTGSAVGLLGWIALITPSGAALATDAQTSILQDGKAGFVVSHIAFALSKDANETGACPDGMTQGNTEIFSLSPEGRRHNGESDQDYARRVAQGAQALGTAPNGQNLCMNPEAGPPDPHFRTVTGKNVPAEGIDLDGQDSHANGKAAPGLCPHEDFRGLNGERGIDNQFFRLVGCSKAFQSTGPYSEFDVGMYTGSWGILITLKGVNDLRNAKDVEVGFYANADPIQLSPTRQAIPNATYAMGQDPRYRAIAHGRIVNGVLTTDPVDVRFPFDVNSIHLERPLRDARLRATFTPDGGLEGILAGYTPIADLYDFQYGFRNGKDAGGKPANSRLIFGSANGQARVLDQTCNGAYYAMQRLADGHRDPKTGQCTSISTQYRIKAIPAFVVDTPTQSVNAVLDKSP